MYAQIVFNLPVDGPFDYYIPPELNSEIKPGIRVGVSFGRRSCIGYVVGKSRYTQVKKVKPILRVIDRVPILDRLMLRITRRVADYYACSWGEAIESSIPLSLRKGKRIELKEQSCKMHRDSSWEIALLQGASEHRRWELYLREIGDNIRRDKGVIFLAPDKEQADFVQGEISQRLNIDVGLLHSQQSAKEELSQWIKIKQDKLRVVVGTRMAIFAPLPNLGLIIITEEQSPVYKQDSVPHYNAVGVAIIRAKIEMVKLILSSLSPSLESWYQAQKKRYKYILKDTQISVPQIKIIDLKRVGFTSGRRGMKLSITLEESIRKVIEQDGRILLFLNRRGFAIVAYCKNCGLVLRCPRCNANLILHFQNNKLLCHRCNYKTQSPRLCPQCNSGYISYSGLGTEKLESEISRIYPYVSIARLDKDERSIPEDARVVIATESIFRHTAKIKDFDLIGVISPDAVLNLPDFRAAERVFSVLFRLCRLTHKYLIIQTNFPNHYCFKALEQRRPAFFYEKELALRRQSELPPFNHIIMVSLRGRNKERVSSVTEELFNLLNTAGNSSIKVVTFSAQIPYKKRDRYYEQILIKTKRVIQAVRLLKDVLSNFHRSGIIITVDVDPI